MNLQAFRDVLAAIKAAPPSAFNMRFYLLPGEEIDQPECETVGCIAGFAFLVGGGKQEIADYFANVGTVNAIQNMRATATQFLGLYSNQAEYVFTGKWSDRPGAHFENITRDEVIAYLEAVVRDRTIYPVGYREPNYCRVITQADPMVREDGTWFGNLRNEHGAQTGRFK